MKRIFINSGFFFSLTILNRYLNRKFNRCCNISLEILVHVYNKTSFLLRVVVRTDFKALIT